MTYKTILRCTTKTSIVDLGRYLEEENKNASVKFYILLTVHHVMILGK